MQVNFEHLEDLPKILQKLENIEKHLQSNYSKRWLTVKELALYLGYSKDHIYKIKTNEWIEGYHYYKRIGKLFFDSHIIDKWVMGEDDTSMLQKETASQIVDRVLASIKIKKE